MTNTHVLHIITVQVIRIINDNSELYHVMIIEIKIKL